MSKWIRPFGLVRAELFEADEDGEYPPLWEAAEALLVLLFVADLLTLPLTVLLLFGIGGTGDPGSD